MLSFLNNTIERTFAVTAAGVRTSDSWLTAKKILFRFRHTTQILLYAWMASFKFLL